MDRLRFLKITLLLVIFLAPLFIPLANFGYEQIKVLFFIFMITVAGFIWIILSKNLIKLTKIKIISICFISSLLITSLAGLNFQASLLGQEPYYQGWILYVYLLLFAFMVSQIKIKQEYFAISLAGVSIIVSFLAIKDWILLNYFHQQVPLYAGRVVSSFGQPNFYAGLLLLTLPFYYYLFQSKIKKLSYFGGIGALISITGILVSYSRSAILLALLLLVLGLVAQLKDKFKSSLVISGVFLVSILIALKFSSGIIGSEFSIPLQTLNPDLTKESVEKRAYIWPVTWQIIIQQPIAGYGLENINQAFANYFEVNKHLLFEENLKISPVLISLKELNIDRSHNYPLDLLLFSGIPGLTAWTILVSLLFWKLIRKHCNRTQNILLVSLITYLVWVQFQNQSVVHLIYFWFLVGLIDQDEK